MKRIILIILFWFTALAVQSQVLRAFTPRYYNSSVRGNIVYVSNSIITTSGIASGNPGTGEAPPNGTSKNNGGAGAYIDVDNPPFTPVFALGANWRRWTLGTTPTVQGALTWKMSTYNDGAASWTGTGNANYGYGDTHTQCIPSGGGGTACAPTGTKWMSYYFRKTVNIASLAGIGQFKFDFVRDDGIVVYVNGTEVFRNNMPGGAVINTTAASTNISGAAETAVNTYILNGTAPFVAGSNVIAVEIHQDVNSSSDLNFDMALSYGNNNGTFSSSTGDLTIPTTCNQVLFAGLYWGVDQGTDGTNTSWMTAGYNTVKLKIPGSPTYQTITSQQTDIHNGTVSPGLPHTGYLCFANITSLINTTNANGTYTVADIVGPLGIANSCGGWTLVIAYSNPSLQPRNLTVFDGSVIINQGDPPVNVNISGFLTPPSGPVSCELGSVVYDGDRGSTDSFAFRQNGAPAFYNLAMPVVPLNGTQDAWNSKISYKGSVVTTRNPAFQNTLGYDASIFDLPNTSNAQLANNQTAATVRFSSNSENYFVHVVTTSISQYNPTFSVNKTSTDINGGTVVANDSLRYQINYTNVGNDASVQTTIIDNIPAGTTYRPGSLRINGVAKTDAAGDDQAEYDYVNNRVVFRLGTGANAVTGGNMPINSSGNVQFDVMLAGSCSILTCLGSNIRNIARMNYVGLTSNSSLFDSSGVDIAGCITQGATTNFVLGPCSSRSDTLMVNTCPASSVLLPLRRYTGYRFYSAMPFVAGNLYDPTIPVTSSHVYWAHFINEVGCGDTVRIRVIITNCPDIDDDNDGIPDYVELDNPVALQNADGDALPNWNDPTYGGFIDNNSDGVHDLFDPSADFDNDGIINFYDSSFPGYVDSNGDGINDNMDKDLDGIPNHLDLDSDNDGIPDTVESNGVDENGDGIIDNYSTSDNDGFSQNVDASTTGVTGSGNGLGALDFDADLIPNYFDTDSDNDGIPDIAEVFGPDANNDGHIDGFTDVDADGLSDNADSDIGNDGTAENTAISLLRTGPDTNADGRANSYPFKNFDMDGRPNPYDLDSDMDGITDVREAGFTDANYNGFIDGAYGSDGWSNTVRAMSSLTLLNSDGTGRPNYLDIDSDGDGITDNIEGQTTASYRLPAYADVDNDGLDNNYDLAPFAATFGGAGVLLSDRDGDTVPDYIDLDTDADGQPDLIEGHDWNLDGQANEVTTPLGTDTDGDGLDGLFDLINSTTNIKGTSLYMGTSGSTTGDPTPGTRATVQRTLASGGCSFERDWRCVNVVLPIKYLQLNAAENNNSVTLNWGVISSLYLNTFEIERSTDNINYQQIGTQTAAITLDQMTNFAGHDNIAGIGSTVIYYRIKVIAVNGQVKYSNVVAIRKEKSVTIFTVHPNPANDIASVRFSSEKEGTVVITIRDFVGKLVYQQNVKALKGNNILSLTGLSNYSNGVYHVQVLIDEEIKTAKLVIRH